MDDRQLTDRGRQRRDQLLTVAARLFAENGFHPTSVADIVSELGVGKGVFYWYFASKEDLFLEIMRAAQYDLRRQQQRALDQVSDPVERIAAGIRTSLEWAGDHRDLFALFQLAATDERFGPVLRTGEQTSIDDATVHVKAVLEDRGITDADPELLATALVGVTTHLVRTRLLERGDPVDVLTDVAIRFCLHGILG